MRNKRATKRQWLSINSTLLFLLAVMGIIYLWITYQAFGNLGSI